MTLFLLPSDDTTATPSDLDTPAIDVDAPPAPFDPTDQMVFTDDCAPEAAWDQCVQDDAGTTCWGGDDWDACTYTDQGTHCWGSDAADYSYFGADASGF